MFLPIQAERDKHSWKHVVPDKYGRGLCMIRLMNASVSEHSSLKNKVPFHSLKCFWENIRPPPETSQQLQLSVDASWLRVGSLERRQMFSLLFLSLEGKMNRGQLWLPFTKIRPLPDVLNIIVERLFCLWVFSPKYAMMVRLPDLHEINSR